MSRKVREAGMRHRRLAEGGEGKFEYDEELQQILESCVDFEEANDLLRSTVLSADTSPSDPATIKAKLVALAHETVSSFTASPTTDKVDTTSSRATGDNIMTGLAYEDLPSTPFQPLQPLGVESTESHLPSVKGDTLADILFQDSETGLPDAALEAGAWLEQIPTLTATEEKDEVVFVESSPPGSPESDVQPSTSAAASAELLPASPAQTTPRHHRFVRLPKVQSGAIRRTLMVQAANSGPRYLSKSSSFDILATLRALFAKSELDANDVEELCQAVEKLVNYAHKRISPNLTPRRFGRLVGRLGLYFLILDSVMNACEVLGPAALTEHWWDAFTGRFRTKYPEVLKSALRTSEATEFNHNLWNPWRKDDELYQLQQDSFDESEDQEDDEE
ncbi:hypothetical protein Esti_006192 [Eimeria stiedai]